MHHEKDIFLKCSLGSKRGWDVLKHRSQFQKQFKITCQKGGSKICASFLVVQPLTLFELMVYHSNYLQNLELKGEMWLAIEDLYAGVEAQILFSGLLSRIFDVSQGTEKGRILAPFMCKVNINSLLYVLSDHNYAVCIRSLQLTSPNFADDIASLALHPSFLDVFMDMYHQYGIKWRYEFNHTKTGAVTFGESNALHFQSMNERDGSWEMTL